MSALSREEEQRRSRLGRALGRSGGIVFVTGLVVMGLASPTTIRAAVDSTSSPTSLSRSTAPRCISLPGRAIEAVGWSPDGNRLAVASKVDLNSETGSTDPREHVITVVDWPSLRQSDAYSNDELTDLIEDVAVGPDDVSVYFDAALGDTNGLWVLDETGQAVLLQKADPKNLGFAGLESTTQGLVRLASPTLSDPESFNLPNITPMLRDWSGTQRAIGPAAPFGAVWFSPDLHWMVGTSLQGEIEVRHDGSLIHVQQASTFGVGMTEARTSIIEVLGDAAKGLTVELVALDGTAVGWSQTLPKTTEKLPDYIMPALSSRDVLAVGSGDELCLVSIPQTATPTTNNWLVYAIFVGVLAVATLLTSRSGLLDRVRRRREVAA